MVTTLEGKVALVTGGSSGIGRATAIAFVRNGAKVVMADIDVEGGQETGRMIKQSGGDAIFIKTDVSKASEVIAMIDKTIATYGHLDCAYNNAGILYRGPSQQTSECTEEDWDRLMSINLKGLWLCMKYEIRQMLKQGSGAIVNTSSIAGIVALRDSVAYNASKHGVTGLTRAAALEYAKSGIRVNAVCPGFIKTPMTEPPSESAAKAFAERMDRDMPMGRMGTPEEVAEAVVWLCSDAASFITGHPLAVDGGWMAQ